MDIKNISFDNCLVNICGLQDNLEHVLLDSIGEDDDVDD